jgi:hypothetical protein
MSDKIREIASRGYWSSGVFDHWPRKGMRIVRVEGKFATEADAIAKANAVIAEGRPNISTFIHQPTAKPSVHFNISHADCDEIGRALAAITADKHGRET